MVRVGDSMGAGSSGPINPGSGSEPILSTFGSETTDLKNDVEVCYNLLDAYNVSTWSKYLPAIIERFERIVACSDPRVTNEMKEHFKTCIDQYKKMGRVYDGDLCTVAFDDIKKLGPCPERERVEEAFQMLEDYIKSGSHDKNKLKKVYELLNEMYSVDFTHTRLTSDENIKAFDFILAYKFSKKIPSNVLEKTLAVLQELKSRKGDL